MNESRKKKLVHPRQQGRLILLALLAMGASVLLNVCLTAWVLSDLAGELPNDGEILHAGILGTLATTGGLTLLLAAPIFLALGLAATFRIFGPLHRFRVFLTDVIKGFQIEPCQLRQHDELQDLCKLLNRATAAQRETNGRAVIGDEGTNRTAA